EPGWSAPHPSAPDRAYPPEVRNAPASSPQSPESESAGTAMYHQFSGQVLRVVSELPVTRYREHTSGAHGLFQPRIHGPNPFHKAQTAVCGVAHATSRIGSDR